MWLFTTYGFFSAVCARQGDGGRGQPVDPGRIMVRARRREHLEALRSRFPDLLGDAEVLESRGTDYRYRLLVDKPKWVEVVGGLTDELDYDNFKGKVAHQHAAEAPDYQSALHEVWSVMNATQR